MVKGPPRRGEVWWVERPDEKRRPYLLLTRDSALGVLDRWIAVPATRSARHIATHVHLDQADGMPQACALALDGVRTLPPWAFVERICALGPGPMDAVCTALRVATGC